MKSSSWIHDTNWRPSPSRPTPHRARLANTRNTPPGAGPMTSEVRNATFRVRGVGAAAWAPSHASPMATLRGQSGGRRVDRR
ncbi:MAG: hypothetical protein WDM96_13860 [Lacunisphaera sp.]